MAEVLVFVHMLLVLGVSFVHDCHGASCSRFMPEPFHCHYKLPWSWNCKGAVVTHFLKDLKGADSVDPF